MVMERVAVVLAVAVAGWLAPATAHADGTIDDLQNSGQAEQPFIGALYRSGFGYLDAQRVLSDGAVACVNDMNGVPVDLITQMLTARSYSAEEAQAIVVAMQQTDHTDGFPPLC